MPILPVLPRRLISCAFTYEDYVLGQGNANSAKGASNGASEWKYGSGGSFPFGYGLSYIAATIIGSFMRQEKQKA